MQESDDFPIQYEPECPHTSTQPSETSSTAVKKGRDTFFRVEDLARTLAPQNPLCRVAVMSVLHKIRTNQIEPTRTAKDASGNEQLFDAKELLGVICMLPVLATQPKRSGTEFDFEKVQHSGKLAGILESWDNLSAKRLLEVLELVCYVINVQRLNGKHRCFDGKARLVDAYGYLKSLSELASAVPSSTEFR